GAGATESPYRPAARTPLKPAPDAHPAHRGRPGAPLWGRGTPPLPLSASFRGGQAVCRPARRGAHGALLIATNFPEECHMPIIGRLLAGRRTHIRVEVRGGYRIVSLFLPTRPHRPD